ncbi:MAG: hypothetical protein IJJ69_14200 [Oscillospiraceae bacterium]|nr:hypothetical protein [Oscillospiraceae bacterium]
MTDKEKAIVTLYTGYAMMEGEKLSEVYAYAAELMNRPVYTHELFSDEVQAKVKPEFIAMCADETPVIDLKDEMFGGILCCAVRYALTRASSASFTVTQFIRPLLPYLSDLAVQNIKRIISECAVYGDSCDVRTWLNFMDDVKAEIEKRGIL